MLLWIVEDYILDAKPYISVGCVCPIGLQLIGLALHEELYWQACPSEY